MAHTPGLGEMLQLDAFKRQNLQRVLKAAQANAIEPAEYAQSFVAHHKG